MHNTTFTSRLSPLSLFIATIILSVEIGEPAFLMSVFHLSTSGRDVPYPCWWFCDRAEATNHKIGITIIDWPRSKPLKHRAPSGRAPACRIHRSVDFRSTNVPQSADYGATVEERRPKSL